MVPSNLKGAAKEPLTPLSDASVSQDAPGTKRVCYGCEAGDLFLWLNKSTGAPASFQLTFYTEGDDRKEYAIHWDGRSLKTGLVDSKEVDGRSHDLQAPTVQFFAETDAEALRQGRQFLRERGSQLPPDLRALLERVMER